MGLRQGYPMSPIQFNIYIMGLQHLFVDVEDLPKIGAFYVSPASFADNIFLASHLAKGWTNFYFCSKKGFKNKCKKMDEDQHQ